MHEDLVAAHVRRARRSRCSSRSHSRATSPTSSRCGIEQWQRRADLNTWWLGPNSLESRYRNEDFVRRCLVRALTDRSAASPTPTARCASPSTWCPGEEWRLCLQYDLLTTDDQLPAARDPLRRSIAEDEDRDARQARSWQISVSQIEPADIRLQFAYERAIEDLAALRLHEQESSFDHWMPAAGLPWFMALFGRDSLIASMQAMIAQPAVAIGTLENLARVAVGRRRSRNATRSRARFRTSCGSGSGRISGSCRTARTTGPPTPHLCICCCSPRTIAGSGDAGVAGAVQAVRPSGASSGSTSTATATATASRSTRRARQRGYRNQALARRARRRARRDRRVSRAADRHLARCRPTSTARRCSMAPLFEAWGEPERAAALRSEAAELRRKLHRDVLARSRRASSHFVLDGRKRRGAHGGLEPGPLPVDGDPRRGAGPGGGAAPDAAGHVHGLGTAHAVRPAPVIRPAFLPARVGVAARQRDRSGGAAPLRDGRGGVDHARRPARRR